MIIDSANGLPYQEYRLDGVLHRLDGPAVLCTVGNYWYKFGSLHRDDGPACEFVYGDKQWYQHGRLHREDGPAVEYADGAKAWYFEGSPYYVDSLEEFQEAVSVHKVRQVLES